MKRRLALYPVLLAVALVVELITVSGASPFSAGRVLILAIAVSLTLAWVARALMGDPDRGGVLAVLWVLALFSGENPIMSLAILAMTVLLLIERFLVPSKTIRWPRIGLILSRVVIVFALAVAIQAVQIGSLAAAVRSVFHETALRPAPADVPAGVVDPDIYMLMLDGHARADVLRDVFDRDGTAFTSALAANGFVVADRSRSNYTQTGETLSSMFNEAHLRDVPRMAGLLAGTEGEVPGAVVRNAINDNATSAFLRSRGYEVDAISPGFEQVVLRESDRFVDTGQINEFELTILKNSIVGHVVGLLSPDAISAQQRDRIQGVLDSFESAPSWSGDRPRFVFAHVPSPHPPWVSHADGSPRTVGFRDEWLAETPASTGLTIEQLKVGYADQVADTDRRLLEALPRLDAAIAARGRPAVVILFSDHGSWIGADGGDIRLRFKNLLAVRSTDGRVVFEPNLTLVNLFPSLFHQIFGTEWVRRADTEYRFGEHSAFELFEVADPDASASP